MRQPLGTLKDVLQKINRGRLHFLWAGLFYILVTILMTWPLAARMGFSFVGQIGDNLYFVWLIEWIRKAVFELHVSPVFVPFLNYPDGWSLAYTEITPAMIGLALPASLLGGPFFGYNFALLASFVLSGIGMYIWIHHLTGNRGAALVAGMIFAFLPYRMAHFLIGHLNLSGTQWFPFYFMGLYDLLRQPPTRARGGAWKPVLLAGISLGLIALTSQYYLYMTALVSAVFVVVYLVRTEHRAAWLRMVWKPFAGFGAVALPLVLVSVLPFSSFPKPGTCPTGRSATCACTRPARRISSSLPPTISYGEDGSGRILIVRCGWGGPAISGWWRLPSARWPG
jgi:hypothetical protein